MVEYAAQAVQCWHTKMGTLDLGASSLLRACLGPITPMYSASKSNCELLLLFDQVVWSLRLIAENKEQTEVETGTLYLRIRFNESPIRRYCRVGETIVSEFYQIAG